ncbi:MAG TPA: DUF5777 family beta-barrel protein [Vicinamibacterales bacterium]|nr:DUF5777 family beta-barrel protein [Vicinamibacterales bacterium]
MPRLARWILVFLLVAGIGSARLAAGQTPPPPATSTPQDPAPAQAAPQAPASQPAEDDDRVTRLVEPDFTVVNLPTTLILPRHALNFRLTHRFLGNLRQGSFTDNLSNLFGLDNGAIIGLEFRYAPIRHVQAIVYRNNLSKTIQFTGQYEAIRQGASSPVSASAIVSIEGTNNFRSGHSDDEGGGEHDHGVATGHRSPALGGIISRSFSDRLAVYAVPMWVHHVIPSPARDTFYIGVGGRARLMRTVYVVGEVSPRLNGYAPGHPAFAFGIERRAGGHMFQLNFGNSLASTYGQTAQGGFPDTIYLGFNLGRKFY